MVSFILLFALGREFNNYENWVAVVKWLRTTNLDKKLLVHRADNPHINYGG
jgi:hypothetical protein